jgi:hypothetical protein
MRYQDRIEEARRLRDQATGIRAVAREAASRLAELRGTLRRRLHEAEAIVQSSHRRDGATDDRDRAHGWAAARQTLVQDSATHSIRALLESRMAEAVRALRQHQAKGNITLHVSETGDFVAILQIDQQEADQLAEMLGGTASR